MDTATNTMQAHLIESTRSGIILGAYLADSHEDARRMLAIDAGYESF